MSTLRGPGNVARLSRYAILVAMLLCGGSSASGDFGAAVGVQVDRPGSVTNCENICRRISPKKGSGMAIPPIPKLKTISKPIAEETTPYASLDGNHQYLFKTVIGRPVKHWKGPNSEQWFCPVYFEHHLDKGIKCFKGTGPVSSLANAGVWIHDTFYKVVVEGRSGS